MLFTNLLRSVCYSMKILAALLTLVFTFLASTAWATVIPVASGYEVSYNIKLYQGATPPGIDIENVLIFEWDDTQRNLSYPFAIAGSGNTVLSHIVPFEPTSAFVIGSIAAVPGAPVGTADAKRHLYTLSDVAYSDYLVDNFLGVKFSQLFGKGEQTTIDLTLKAINGNSAESLQAQDALWSFVTGGAQGMVFNPAGEFRVHKWSPTTAPTPKPKASLKAPPRVRI